jgi:hypothetical protein
MGALGLGLSAVSKGSQNRMYYVASDVAAKGRGAVRVIPCFGRSGKVGLIHLSPWLANIVV